MARERMVTRTVEVTKVQYLGMDIVNQTVHTMEYHFTGTDTEDKILKYIKKHCDTDTFKAVAITSITTEEKLYGMYEWEFVQLSRELDPTTRKLLDSTEDEEV